MEKGKVRSISGYQSGMDKDELSILAAVILWAEIELV